MIYIILYIIFSIVGLLTGFIFLFLFRRNSAQAASPPLSPPPADPVTSSPKDVQTFYDAYTADFRKVYGDVIQAFRTRNPDDLLEYQSHSMGLQGGLKILDAGCGVCGPAIFFAKENKLSIDAVTISAEQVKISESKVHENKLEDRINVIHGDYHLLETLVDEDTYDMVYFLESFGHSHENEKAVKSAFKVLKPGGKLYIKDLFRKVPAVTEHTKPIEDEIQKINRAYHYHIMDLGIMINTLRQSGFIVSFIKTIDLPLEKFENLTISNDFQELTGIGKIDNWDNYIFPVDFFEILCLKPEYDLEKGSKRYFLQNLYQMQVNKWKKSDL